MEANAVENSLRRSASCVTKSTRSRENHYVEVGEYGYQQNLRLGQARAVLQENERSSASDDNSRTDSIWTEVNTITGKVVGPDEIRQFLTNLAGKYAADTPRIEYLTRLFFRPGGPDAFRQIRNAFAAICRTREVDYRRISRTC